MKIISGNIGKVGNITLDAQTQMGLPFPKAVDVDHNSSTP